VDSQRRQAEAMETTTATSPQDTSSDYDNYDGQGHGYHTPPLERPAHDRMLAGVAAGAARYLGVDPTVIRIILAVLVVCGGVGVPLYVAGWLLIPEEGHEQSMASELIHSFQSHQR
jgi:phage shock protein PspC (stress-responsive transcriptional regulator)